MGNSSSSSASSSKRKSKYYFNAKLDAPPPYTGPVTFPEPQAASSALGPPSSTKADKIADYLQMPMRQETTENALEILRKYDTVILLDDSGSMKGSPWQDAQGALSALADIAGKYDADGIDVHFLNSTKVGKNLRSLSEVKALFNSTSPSGYTPIGERLEALLLPYLSQIEAAKEQGGLGTIKPINFLVITDGVPTDDPESVIVAAARRLDKGNFPLSQLGIQFVQIGSDQGAMRFLQDLDNELTKTHQIRDIVDTTPCTYTRGKITSDVIIKVLIGGINRRVDRKGVLNLPS